MMRRATSRAVRGWQNRWSAAVLLVCVCVWMGGCAGAGSGPSVAVATSVPATVAPTATVTVTPGVTDTATVAPTVTPTSSPTSSPTATASPTATSEPVEVDISGWRVPLIVGGLTVTMIQELEDTAAGLQAGTMTSVDAGSQLMAFGIMMGLLAQTLEESTLTGGPAGYRQPLQDNMAAVYQVIDRWQQGEITSATVPAELAGVRAASERTLAAMLDDLRALGVPQENLDEFMAEVMAGL